MTDVIQIPALDGIELIINSGMPFHGPTSMSSRGDVYGISGHIDPVISGFGRLRTDQYHYPFRFENRAFPWDHYMSHMMSFDDDSGSLMYGQDMTRIRASWTLPCARNGTGGMLDAGNYVPLGVPFSLAGTPAPALASRVHGENSVLLSALPRLSRDRFGSIYAGAQIDSFATFTYNPGATGCVARYSASSDSQTNMLTPDQLEAYAGIGQGMTRNQLRLTFLDAHGSRAMFAVTPRYNLSAPKGPAYWWGNEADPGRLAAWRQVGLQIVCLIEIERFSDDISDSVVRVLKTAKQCEGTVERTDDPQIVNHGTHSTYHMKTTQEGAVLDAWYDSDGQAQYRLYDAEYEFSGMIGGAKVNGVFYECHHTNRAKVSVTGLGSKEYIQTLTHAIDEVEGWSPGDSNNNSPPRVTVTNTITEDGSLVAEDILEKVYVTPTDFTALAGTRAPYAGPEVRAAAFGFGVGYPGYTETYNPRTFSLFARNNGSGTCVLYGVVETFRRHPDAPVVKSVSASRFVSRDTVRELPAFVDTVEYEDERYWYADLWRDRGYVGNKLFATINLATGALHDMGTDDPIGHTNWR